MRPFRFFFTLFYVTLIPLLSPVFLHLRKYLIGIVVSNILSLVRHDLGHTIDYGRIQCEYNDNEIRVYKKWFTKMDYNS